MFGSTNNTTNIFGNTSLNTSSDNKTPFNFGTNAVSNASSTSIFGTANQSSTSSTNLFGNIGANSSLNLQNGLLGSGLNSTLASTGQQQQKGLNLFGQQKSPGLGLQSTNTTSSQISAISSMNPPMTSNTGTTVDNNKPSLLGQSTLNNQAGTSIGTNTIPFGSTNNVQNVGTLNSGNNLFGSSNLSTSNSNSNFSNSLNVNGINNKALPDTTVISSNDPSSSLNNPTSNLFGQSNTASLNNKIDQNSLFTGPNTKSLSGDSYATTGLPSASTNSESNKLVSGNSNLFSSTLSGTSGIESQAKSETSTKIDIAPINTKNDTNTNNTQGTSNSGQLSTALQLDVSTAASLQHERVDDVLKSWESRLAKQVKLFNKASSDVLAVDKAIITYTTLLYSIRSDQQEMKIRQETMDNRIDQIAQQQNSLASMLRNIEESLSRKLETNLGSGVSTDTSNAQYQNVRISAARANALSTELQEIEGQVDNLMRHLNSVHEKIYPNPLNQIVKILNLHQLTLQSIEDEAMNLKQKLTIAEDCLVRR
ncbi:uncharacterized protein CMU_003840 [Cryptosporidium muris RN66]|uniref:Nucleoporin NSP1-like C-terminal domain-containing protein n=1 Tax=Cryptosporidium muris (strain RN66) TaxID=441375 RepID=B6AK04_CRYMR|nr:uncharacterized protein CMU_003840 [Cryptosporidium muris RN66]EEA08545.1 hypothetical protein, conserved [Cryptosporidium muris RN66]|eukprot:XP_002142894.1 hypothetical protein [Cryptosporidium muris RN66]